MVLYFLVGPGRRRGWRCALASTSRETASELRRQIHIIEATMYSATVGGLDEMQGAWHQTFHRFRGDAGGESIQSWITNAYDEGLDDLATDSEARAYARVVETNVAFVRTP